MSQIIPGSTSSTTGSLYFAYGSNLSEEQMGLRLPNSLSSSMPVAVARLDGWKWIICERGYANIVELEPESVNGTHVSDESSVWGILYNMTHEDEAVLDQYEGHDVARNPNPVPNPDLKAFQRKPYLQDAQVGSRLWGWDYNKLYIPVTVTRWLQPPSSIGIRDESTNIVTVLAYVDEKRTGNGTIIQNYIGRMNRAIKDGVRFGIPQRWVDVVMRRWVMAGVEVDERGYIGTAAGYVPAEGAE